jgi:peroxiredoxin
MPIGTGQTAPDFQLPDQHGQPVRLASFRGHKAVLLAFYPFAFTGTCGRELHELQQRLGELATDRSELLVVSVDSMFAQRVFAEREGFTFPLLADFWPHGAVAASYGAFDDRTGAAGRASFLIDTHGVVQWSVRTGLREARDVQQYVDALEALSAAAAQ